MKNAVDRSAARAVAVIPARFGSTRLPRKALLNETGKFLVQHVWERVSTARRLARVIIATDHDEIVRAGTSFGAEVMMTSPDHASGTDRVHEVARRVGAELVLNVQGDEPEVDGDALDAVVTALEQGSAMATLACPLLDEQKFMRPNHVKVVCDHAGRALYFSRAPIPWQSSATPRGALLHLGVYGFQRETLERFAELEPSSLEQSERLEQLRALAHGIPIQVIVIEYEFSGVDTLEDYAAFVARERARQGGSRS